MGGPVWEVVGGRAQQGIVVRRGRSTASPAEGRLGTGARIEELALEGDRLRYKLLEGSGPHSGWVSVSVAQKGAPPKELVVRVQPLAGDLEPAPTCEANETAPEQALEWASKEPTRRPHPQELEGQDSASKLLRSGVRLLRGAFCKEEDDGLFQGLRVELLRVEVLQDQRIRQTEAAGKLKSGSGFVMTTKRLPVHTFVLNKLAELLDVEGLAWWTNLYEDASVDCKFHRDRSSYGGDADNPNLKPDLSMIASFGATRDFTLLHEDTGREFSFPLENGDVIAFNSEVDEAFLHGLHPAEGRGMPRIAVVMVGQSHDGGRLPKPLLPHFVSIWRPPGEPEVNGRWVPKLLQFSGGFMAGGDQKHCFQDKDGREVFQPHELQWFADRGSELSLSRGIAGPGPDNFSLRGVVRDICVWLERSVDHGMFDVIIRNLIRTEGGDRVERVEFHAIPWEDSESPRIPRLIRLIWRGRSEDDVEAKHAKVLGCLVRDLGLVL